MSNNKKRLNMSVKQQINLVYLDRLGDLHDAAKDILDDLITAQQSVENWEASQENFQELFGKTSGEIAFEIITEKRNVKRLRRSYLKIINQLNATL